MIITIDCETIPDQRPGALDAFIADVRENFKAPSGMTKEQAAKDLGLTDSNDIKFTSKDAMLARWEERFRDEKAIEVAESNWRKTSFDGGAGQIACIALAINDGAAVSYEIRIGYEYGGEQQVLEDFFSHLADVRTIEDRPVFVGHNHVQFDLRFLWQRAIILGVRPPIWFPRNPKAWDDSVFDTMIEWAGHGNRISMDNLCRALDIPGKPDGLDGSMVWDYVRDGRINEVAAYCRGDVERTRAIYKRMTFAEAV